MNWMYNLEKKWGRYAIYDLHKYFVITYLIGFALNYIGEGVFMHILPLICRQSLQDRFGD